MLRPFVVFWIVFSRSSDSHTEQFKWRRWRRKNDKSFEIFSNPWHLSNIAWEWKRARALQGAFGHQHDTICSDILRVAVVRLCCVFDVEQKRKRPPTQILMAVVIIVLTFWIIEMPTWTWPDRRRQTECYLNLLVMLMEYQHIRFFFSRSFYDKKKRIFKSLQRPG